MKRFAALICALALMLLFCSCSDDSSSGRALTDVFSEIKSACSLDNVLEFTDAASLDRHYGIAAEDVSEFAGCISKMSTDQTEIVLIKASDKDAAGRISQALQNKYRSKLQENRNYSPEQYAMIENGVLEINGLYVSMIVAPDAEAINKLYKASVIK